MSIKSKHSRRNSETATEELIAEYTTLRQEVVHNYGKQTNMFLLSVTATVAVLGYVWSAPSQVSSLTYLVPLMILIPCALIIISLRNANDRLNSYIKVFLETEADFLRFETMASKFPYPTSFARQGYISVYQAMVLSQIALGVICLALMLYYGISERDPSPVVIIAATVVGVLSIVLCAFYMIYSELRFSTSRLTLLWERVRRTSYANECTSAPSGESETKL